MNNPNLRPAILGGLAAVLLLDGGIVLGLSQSALIQLMGLNMMNPPAPVVALLIALTLFWLAAGGAAWGWALQRLTRQGEPRRLTLAGALGFAPATIGVAVALGAVEPTAARLLPLPIHRVFTVLFVPAIFVVVLVLGWSLGLALRDRALGWRMGLSGGLAAALGFLVVNLTLDALGFRVGAPFAAERATMLVTAFSGNAGGALLAGGVLTWLTPRRAVPPPPA